MSKGASEAAMHPRTERPDLDSNTEWRAATWALAGSILLLTVLLGLACAKPIPDTDGSSGQARGLRLGRWQADQLHCRDTDCSDWYRVDLGSRGDLVIDVASPNGDPTDFNVILASASSEVLTRASSRGRGRAHVAWSTRAGTYLIEVSSDDPSKQPQAYQIRAEFTPEPPPPPPPEPQFQVLEAEVIEIEGSPARPDAVLVDKGSQAGVSAGREGRLYDGDQQIGSIEIIGNLF